MYVINARNVNEAYLIGMNHLVTHGVRSPSRAGEVFVGATPVTTVYHVPRERLLFEPRRNANPIFHLMESIWMIAGCRDARWLDQFVHDFSSRFAEDDGDAHGAYGYRWRKHFRGPAERVDEIDVDDPDGPVGVWTFPPLDQITKCGELLLNDPTTRQAVMAMWDPAIDLGAKKRDIPCNDLVMFRSRYDHHEGCWYLDTTVSCRSNDAVWGAYGANAVHMSIMAEVVAGLAGMKLGKYYQISNNFHVYADILAKVWPPTDVMDPYRHGLTNGTPILETMPNEYTTLEGRKAIAERAAEFVRECELFIAEGDGAPFQNDFMRTIAAPIYAAHVSWKKDKQYAFSQLKHVAISDWKYAVSDWMARRMGKV